MEQHDNNWECRICGFTIDGGKPPVECPLCKAPESDFFRTIAKQRTTVQRLPVNNKNRETGQFRETDKAPQSNIISEVNPDNRFTSGIPLSRTAVSNTQDSEQTDFSALRRITTDMLILVPVLEASGYPEIADSLKKIITEILVETYREDSKKTHKLLNAISTFNNRHISSGDIESNISRKLKDLETFLGRVKSMI
ncbi:MAG: hypothetical protein JXR95_04475 [Deltaproteobacteria bacterium]|nr:hypothetical protein [Deltaproteobacteria bacterium]